MSWSLQQQGSRSIGISLLFLLAGLQVLLILTMHDRPELLWGGALIGWAAQTALIRPARNQATAWFLVMVTLILMALRFSGSSGRAQAFGFLATALCAVPFLLRPLRQSRDFPFLHLFCLVQGVYLYVGFLIGSFQSIPGAVYTRQAREEGLLAYAAFMAAVVLFGVLTLRQARLHTPLRHSIQSKFQAGRVFPRALGLCAVGYMGPIALSAAGLAGGLGAILNMVNLLKVLGFVALVALWGRRSLTPVQKAVVIGICVVDVISGLGTGALYNGVVLVIAAFAFVVADRRRIAWLAIVAAVPALLVLNVAKAEFRLRDRTGAISDNVAIAGFQLIDIAHDIVAEPDAESFKASAERFAFADVLGYVRVNVPHTYPYWDKRSYSVLPFTLIPRALVPSKPTYRLANEFGREYGIISPSDFDTSVNTPIAVEAYVNLGLWGMMVMGAFTGLVLGLLGRRWRTDSLAQTALGAVVIAQLLAGIESGMAAWILVPVIILLFGPIVRWLLPQSTTLPIELAPTRLSAVLP